jgi:hypothetical protein
MPELLQNNHPLNQRAKELLEQEKAEMFQDSLYSLQLLEWAMENNKVSAYPGNGIDLFHVLGKLGSLSPLKQLNWLLTEKESKEPIDLLPPDELKKVSAEDLAEVIAEQITDRITSS